MLSLEVLGQMSREYSGYVIDLCFLHEVENDSGLLR